MAMAENEPPAKPAVRDSVPRIDLSKAGIASAKRNKNKNRPSISTPSSLYSRQPTLNHNRTSGHIITSGLPSPPSSQTNIFSGGLDHHSDREKEREDPARLLISPPPEEELQAISGRRSSSHRPSMIHLNDSYNTNSTSPKLPHPKRKRSMAPTLSYAGASSSNSSEGNPTIAPPASGSGPLATPNPKPRKQSRKSHIRTRSNQSDISMESPTRATRVAEKVSLPSTSSTPSRNRNSYQLMRSPHTSNPNADYIPPYRLASSEEPRAVDEGLLWPQTRKPARMGRRSVTPVITTPYEPPSVVFTPPREVVLSPVASVTKSKQKRKVGKGFKLDIQVKKEPPSIDLSIPMPPASPTDDPLLLSGPPEEDLTATPPRSRSRVMRDAAVFADPAQEISARKVILHESLPPSSPPAAMDDLSSPSHPTYHWPNIGVYENDDRSSDSMDLDMQPHEYANVEGPIPNFGFSLDGFPVDTAWSDSDDDDIQGAPHTPVRETGVIEEGIGEFTGRWHMTKVRTKADPPSSATRMRIEDWGRPISPYPYTVSRPSSRTDVRSPSPSLRQRVSTHEREETVEIRVPVGAAEEEEEGGHPANVDRGRVEEEKPICVELSKGSQEVEIDEDDEDEGQEEEEQEVRDMSLPPDQEDSEEEEEEVRRLSMRAGENDVEEDLDPGEQEPPQEREAEAGKLNSTDDAGAGPFGSAPISQTPFRTRPREGQVSSSPAPLRDLSFLGRRSEQSRSGLRVSAAFERAKEIFGVCSSPLKSPLAEGSDDDDDEMEPVDTLLNLPAEKPTVQEEVRGDDDDDEGAALINEAAEMSSGDESDPTVEDPGLVQITSSDPKAAARAAAILKQHDYDCFTKIVLKQQHHRRNSLHHSAIDGLKRDNRRKTLAGSGVVKDKARASPRHSLGMVIGDKVYIPGSPVMTLGGLLKEAEKEVQSVGLKNLPPRSASSLFRDNTLVGLALGERDLYHTPQASKFISKSKPHSSLMHELVNQGDISQSSLPAREWSKDDWKILDGCFTDERIELASRIQPDSILGEGDEEIPLVGVDLVDIDDVVERFVIEVGGEKSIDVHGWSRESLRARAKAIQNKQRAGHIAPPTTPYTPRTIPKSREPQQTSMQVPNLTPLGRRPFPAARKRVSLPPPLGAAAPFNTISDNMVEPPTRKKVPTTLLAPRYSHLLDETVAISQELPSAEPPLVALDTLQTSSFVKPPLTDTASVPSEAPEAPVQRPTGLGRLFSYIPGLSKSPVRSTRKPAPDARLGLPLPPAEILEKPRGPISTPARPTAPKPKAPKELVNLNHQPIPESKAPSMIPRPKPQRLVELNPVGLPEEHQPVAEPIRARRSSGSSVKDLIKGFEERRESLEVGHQLTKAKSIGNLKKSGDGKPVWKP